MNKIFIYRLGGLGNQLFQIANGYSLSRVYNKELVLNPKTNDGIDINTYRNNFNDLFKIFKKEEIPVGTPILRENGFNYKKIPDLSGYNNIILNGYFQSEKYFINHKEEIKNLFLSLFDNIKIYKNNECFGNNTISLHIRRTDYLNNPNIHPTCSMEYYKKALELLNYEAKKVFIFSDDVKFCSDNEFFKTIKNKEIVKRKFTNDKSLFEIDTLIDFYNMSGCFDHIISNSTFSWWSSYLSSNYSKKIIAPKIWFGKDFYNSWQDIYTNEMILI